MNLKNKRIITVLFGLVITSSLLFLAINVKSVPLSTQSITTEAIYMYVEAASGQIQGDSTATGHEGLIEIYQFSHNMYSTPNPGAATTIFHTPLTVVKLIDKASVPLWKALSIGEALLYVELFFYSTGDVLYFEIKLESAIVVSILSDADIGNHYEMVSFVYGTIFWTDRINDITENSTWI